MSFCIVLNRVEVDGSLTRIYSHTIPMITVNQISIPIGWEWVLIHGDEGRPCHLTIEQA